MTKADIIGKVKELLQAELSAESARAFKPLREDYLNLVKIESDKLLDSFLEEGGKRADFIAPKSEQDVEFEELTAKFRDKAKAFREKREAQEQKNLLAKKEVLVEIENIVEEEENIGRAFSRFKAAQERWKSIGPVPSAVARETQHDYSQLIESFFYNINIYKELQENDLKKNAEQRKSLIDKIAALKDESSIQELEILLPAFIAEWDEIGPVHRDAWGPLRDEFRKNVSEQYGRIKEHYKSLRDDQKKSHEAKAEFIKEVKDITARSVESNRLRNWEKNTSKVIDIQKAWKSSGFSGKRFNERDWKEFRAVCDEFFKQKETFYHANKESQSKIIDIKKRLIAEAEGMKDSTKWGETTKAYLKIQQDWKKSGSVHPREERKLWNSFRKACDHFFNRKKEYFSTIDDRKKENVSKKKDVIQELSKLAKSKSASKETLEGLILAYQDIGPVPNEEQESISKAFVEARKKVYDALKIDDEERKRHLYDIKLKRIQSGDNVDQDLKSESKSLKDRLGKLNSSKLQYENNLGFFAHVEDTNPMKKEVLDKIQSIDNSMNEVRERIKTIDLTLKKIRQQ